MKRIVLVLLSLWTAGGLLAQAPMAAPGRVVLKLKPQAEPQHFMIEFATHSRAGGGVWLSEVLSERNNVHLLEFDTTTLTLDEVLDELMEQPNVLMANIDYYTQPRQDPNDPSFLEQWGLQMIQADRAWEMTTGGLSPNGDTIVVAVLDTGFDIYHEDLVDNIWVNRAEIPWDGKDNDENGYVDDYTGWNFIEDSPEHYPDVHGHSVAGIIGARGNNDRGISGINWNIKLMLFETRLVSEIISAYEYIIDQRERYNATNGKEGAFVVATNASFGVNRIFCDDQPMWGEMYDRMGEVGILTAAGAANNAWNIDEVGDMPTTCPSEYLLTVLNTNAEDVRYPGSAFGPVSIDMGSPGHNSFTTYPFDTYGSFGGNSAAAPHLTGAIALLYSAPCADIGKEALEQPSTTALKIKNALIKGVDSLQSLMGYTTTGGRLNVYNSLEWLMDGCLPGSTPPSTSNEPAAEPELHLFPNPVRQQLYLDFPLPEMRKAEVIVYNMLGQIQYREMIDLSQSTSGQHQINVQNWESGAYIVSVKKDNKTMTAKFVIMD